MNPDQEFDRKLAEHVSSIQWKNPQPAERYDLVVIGAGTAGLVTAAGAAGLGARVALVEKHLLGGDCLNVGCVPSKAIIAAARVADLAHNAAEFGIHISQVTTDFAQVMQRMRRLRADISVNDSVQRMQSLGVDVFFGAAQFSDSGDAVEVADLSLKFKKAVICTGTRPKIPPIPGLRDAPFLTNETLFELTELPRRLAVMGGGPMGCEMAQAFAQLGASVTVLETGSRILPHDDEDAAQILTAALRQDGVTLHLESQIQSVRDEGGTKSIRAQVNEETRKFEVDAILLATGRAPNVEALNLEAAGVQCDQRGVVVNDRLRTTNPRIYAAGDVCLAQKFTHAADFSARIVIQNALFWGRARASKLLIPWCTYTSPEVAHVGLTPAEAEQREIRLQTLVQDLKEVDRALLEGQSDGFVKVHLYEGTDRIAGATIVAAHAGELISEVTLAMQQGVGLRSVASTIHPYPTQAEALRKLGDQYNRQRLTPFVKRVLKWILKFT